MVTQLLAFRDAVAGLPGAGGASEIAVLAGDVWMRRAHGEAA